MKKIVIIGATSLIAEYCARLWVAEGPCELILVGRNQEKTAHIAADLAVRNPDAKMSVVVADFYQPEAIQTLADNIAQSGKIDIVLIAQGSLPNQASCQQDLSLCKETLEINALSPVLFAQAFANIFEKNQHGTLALISSVAGERGRKTNYIYGAGKSLATHYMEGLQHYFAGTTVNVLLIKPGPTDTPMTAELKKNGMKMASVQQVAQEIVHAISQGGGTLYTPGKWRWIMSVVRHIPNVIFHKLNI